MKIVLILLVVSALTGILIGGLKYSIYAIVIAGLVIVTVAAVFLRDIDSDDATAMAFGCLIVNQIGYLTGAWLRFISSQERSDDRSGDDC